VHLGLSIEELQQEIAIRMNALDEAQDDAEHFGQLGDLLRLCAQIAFQRAAELIDLNNQRLSEQLAELGVKP
jgi:predicted HTH domain antitoxin